MIILASRSPTRQKLLKNAGIPFEVVAPSIDEAALQESLSSEGLGVRDMADALAEFKAQSISIRKPGVLVLGSDQTMALDGAFLTKTPDRAAAQKKLMHLRGNTHHLYSAAVICENGRALWRVVGQAKLTMRNFSDEFLEDYLDREFENVSHSLGAYHYEGQGVQLFEKVEGDYFTILGMPLLQIISYLRVRGILKE